MKQNRQLLAGLSALLLLCCACSAGPSVSLPADSTADSVQVIPISQSSRSQFIDAAQDAWYAEAVDWCTENDILSGVTADTFAPQDAAVRITIADALYRSAGRPAVSGGTAFSDVEAGSSYASAAAWASANNIMSGYGGPIKQKYRYFKEYSDLAVR